MQKYLPAFVLRTKINCFRSKKIRDIADVVLLM